MHKENKPIKRMTAADFNIYRHWCGAAKDLKAKQKPGPAARIRGHGPTVREVEESVRANLRERALEVLRRNSDGISASAAAKQLGCTISAFCYAVRPMLGGTVLRDDDLARRHSANSPALYYLAPALVAAGA